MSNGVDEKSAHRVEPSGLGEQYHKARKSLALFSGLLFAWEFVGIDLKEKLVPSLDITVKSPEAAPYVLVALIIYFLVRFTLEWFQFLGRGGAPVFAAKVDFSISLSIPVVALATFGIQRLADIRVAEQISATTPLGTGSQLLVVLGSLLVSATLVLPRIAKIQLGVLARAKIPGYSILILGWLGVVYSTLTEGISAYLLINAGVASSACAGMMALVKYHPRLADASRTPTTPNPHDASDKPPSHRSEP